ncbi:TRAP transporter large permease [Desulfitibacter alkalitolerans]|uniref:TRAP transporter large permease n=1 Tax=Desulfitibacter alkalitolerans TaxID=264641 RepID=UPI0004868989|nr:TRAP transporter large permease [Desulfitibacter alkalitolerans]
MVAALLFGLFAVLVIASVPIAVSIGLATILTIWVTDIVAVQVAAQRMFTAVDSFPLMAVPFFMIAGAVMERGGISKRLINFANSLVGSFFGGFALVTILASMFFAAISGSSPATVAAIGAIMIPAMVKNGYKEEFATATQASSGYIGVIIPPSIPMITYGVVTGTSIGGLFMAGFVPGMVIGLSLAIVAVIIAKKNNYRGADRPATPGEIWASFKDAIWAIFMPIIILGGIYGGIFTPTEAANIAVVYGLIVGLFVYKELSFKDLPQILRTAAISSSLVLLIVAAASAFGLILTREQIPMKVAQMLIAITDNPIMLLMILNLLLLVVGTFMETNAAIIILAPILFPAVIQLGIDPIHFGIIMVVNLAIGMITPPLGVNLFVASSMRKMPIEKLINANWWYLLASIIALLVITYFPGLSLWLPSILR